jgi:hypothetical protein
LDFRWDAIIWDINLEPVNAGEAIEPMLRSPDLSIIRLSFVADRTGSI